MHLILLAFSSQVSVLGVHPANKLIGVDIILVDDDIDDDDSSVPPSGNRKIRKEPDLLTVQTLPRSPQVYWGLMGFGVMQP